MGKTTPGTAKGSIPGVVFVVKFWYETKEITAEKNCYIKPRNHERSKTKKYKSNMALRENMAYDPQKDEYTCQAGQKLCARHIGQRRSKSGFVGQITYYECDVDSIPVSA